jgi:hypothetical protein
MSSYNGERMVDYKAPIPAMAKFRSRLCRLLQLIPGFVALVLARYQARFVLGAHQGAMVGEIYLMNWAGRMQAFLPLLKVSVVFAAITLVLAALFAILAKRVLLSWLIGLGYIVLSVALNTFLAKRLQVYRAVFASLGALVANPPAAFAFGLNALLLLAIFLLSWRSLHRSSLHIELGKGVMLAAQFALFAWGI